MKILNAGNKLQILVLILFGLLVQANANAFEPAALESGGLRNQYGIDTRVLDGRSERTHFIGNGGDAYLAMGIPFAPVQTLFLNIQNDLRIGLKNRGEAHVTILTPPETAVLFRAGLAPQQLNDLAARFQIQASDIQIRCLGAGIDPNLEVFFIEVFSKNLIAFRNAVADLVRNPAFIDRDPNHYDPSRFNPQRFFSHITVGFVKQDLHEPQLIKDERACKAQLNLQ